MSSMPLRLALCLSLCLAAFSPRAAELAFAHYAPGAGEVRLQIDDEAPITLAYKTYIDARSTANGSRRLRVARPDGSVLAEGTLELRAADRFVVIVAGNGSNVAPFQLRAATDHNWPLTAGQSSLQVASLAILAREMIRAAAPVSRSKRAARSARTTPCNRRHSRPPRSPKRSSTRAKAIACAVS